MKRKVNPNTLVTCERCENMHETALSLLGDTYEAFYCVKSHWGITPKISSELPFPQKCDDYTEAESDARV